MVSKGYILTFSTKETTRPLLKILIIEKERRCAFIIQTTTSRLVGFDRGLLYGNIFNSLVVCGNPII